MSHKQAGDEDGPHGIFLTGDEPLTPTQTSYILLLLFFHVALAWEGEM